MTGLGCFFVIALFDSVDEADLAPVFDVVPVLPQAAEGLHHDGSQIRYRQRPLDEELLPPQDEREG